MTPIGERHVQAIPVFWPHKTRKNKKSPAYGHWSLLPNFPCLLPFCALHPRQPPMLWSTRQVPVAPRSEKRGRTLFFGSSQEKGLRGLLFLLSDSIYMGTSGPGVYYATQAGCEELWRGRGGWGVGVWSMLHHHGDSVSTASVNRPPGSVRNGTFGCPRGLMGS